MKADIIFQSFHYYRLVVLREFCPLSQGTHALSLFIPHAHTEEKLA
jgi:hypothetical protein